ncbi:hypothetical protein [Streptomyces sp. NPDC051183]|uniref:hypothetical protein n=1 Tax=Streptomyces sp. NPDC051183 TaxID=3155165 RepID=UPI0034242328
MLLAALHCSSHVLGEGLAHTSSASSTAAAAGAHQSWPAEEQTPPHPDHGSACDAPGLTPPTQSRTPSTAVAEGTLPLGHGVDPHSAHPAVAPGAGRAAIAASGRSTLTSVCRWRI